MNNWALVANYAVQSNQEKAKNWLLKTDDAIIQAHLHYILLQRTLKRQLSKVGDPLMEMTTGLTVFVHQMQSMSADNSVLVSKVFYFYNTIKILKIGTPKIITIIVLQMEHLDFTVQYCIQKMLSE